MTTTSDVQANAAAGAVLHHARWTWLALGGAATLLSTGARWDIPLAAWIAPILLLRFARTSGVATALGGLAALSILQIAWRIFEAAGPFNAIAVMASLVFGIVISLPFMLDRLLGGRLGAAGRIFLLPAAMVACEFVIATLTPLGASIGSRANTQGENLALIQIVSLAGPYVIAFIVGCAATVANHIWENPGRTALASYGGAFAAALVAIIGFGEARLAYSSAAFPIETVKIAGIVPRMALRDAAAEHVSMANFPPSAETRAALAAPEIKTLFDSILDELLVDTRRAAKAGARIVVWSETAAPVLEAEKPALLQKAAAVAREEGVYINVAIGVPFERNETFLIGPDGGQLWHYRKNNPVPGMEPVAPFQNAPPVVETPFGRLTNVICYDADFPVLSRITANIMLLPGWDWSEEAYPHTMKVARLRAVENGYAMIRVDYNGVSGAFDRYGRVLAAQNTFTGDNHMMIVDLPLRNAPSLYNRTGDVFAWLCVVAAAGLCLGAALPRRS